MSNDIRKRLNEVRDGAQRQGWRVEWGGAEHLKFYAPNGKDLIVASGSSCSVRGFRNFIARMRRAGYHER